MYRLAFTIHPYRVPDPLKTKIPEAPKRGLHRENCESDKLLLNLVQWQMETQKHPTLRKHQYGKIEVAPSKEIDKKLNRLSELMHQQDRIRKAQSSRSVLKRAVSNHKNRFRSATRKASDTEIENLRISLSDILTALKTHEENRTAFTNGILRNIDNIDKTRAQPESTNKHSKSHKSSKSPSNSKIRSRKRVSNGKHKASKPELQSPLKIKIVEESESSQSFASRNVGNRLPPKINIVESTESSELSGSFDLPKSTEPISSNEIPGESNAKTGIFLKDDKPAKLLNFPSEYNTLFSKYKNTAQDVILETKYKEGIVEEDRWIADFKHRAAQDQARLDEFWGPISKKKS